MRFLFSFLAFSISVFWLAACAPAPSEQNTVPNEPEQKTADISESTDPELEAAIKSMGLLYLADHPPAIDFNLEKLGGGKVKLSDYSGKVIIVNFWATWCGPCRIEMPSMQTLYDQIKGSDVIMLAVDSLEPGEVVDSFIQEFKYTFPILLDTDGAATSNYSIQAFPTTYIIDRSGHVIAGKAGAHDWANPAVKKGLDFLLSRT